MHKRKHDFKLSLKWFFGLVGRKVGKETLYFGKKRANKTKPWQNRKFGRILVRDRPTLFSTLLPQVWPEGAWRAAGDPAAASALALGYFVSTAATASQVYL